MGLKADNYPNHCNTCPSFSSGVFCGLSGNDLDALCFAKKNIYLRKGEALYLENDHPCGAYCVSHGNLKLTKATKDGKIVIVRLVTSGEMLGVETIFAEKVFPNTCEALEDCELCFIDKKFFHELPSKNNTVALNLINRLSQEAILSQNKIVSLSYHDVRSRLAELLLILSKKHGKIEEPGKTKIKLYLTREEMASIIGTSTETLIRSLSELKKWGIIETYEKCIVIPNEKILESCLT